MPDNALPARPAAARWRDRLTASDPGGFSLRAGLRAIIAFVVSGAILLATGQGLGAALLGGSMAMTTSVSVAEPDPLAEFWSEVIAILAAIAAVSAAALVSGSPLAAGVLLCAIVFVAVVARARGARATAAGMLAFMGCFFALFIAAKPAQVPGLAGAIAIGGVTSILVRFLVVRERAERVHASVLRAFRAQLQLLLDQLVEELEGGEGGEKRLRRIRRQTGRVNEAALALEEAAGRTNADAPPAQARPWLMQVLEAELAMDMLADAVHRVAEREWAVERRRPLAAMLRALQRWIETGAHGTREEVLQLLAATTPGEGGSTRELPRAEPRDAELLARRERVWDRVHRGVALLLASRPWEAFPPLPPVDTRVTPSSFRAGGGGTAGVHGLWPNLRVAVQATIAVGLATIAGRAISSERWYWAALAAFVVFSSATTLAETLSRAWQRFFGTLLGVTAGLLIAEMLHRHSTIAAIVAILALFLSYVLLRISYSAMILFVTIALALLYELMGRPVPGLMELRLAETATGAGIGVVIAAVIFPMHSRRRIRRLVAAVLREAAVVIAHATRAGVVLHEEESLHDEVRRVDRALAEVRNALRPLWAPQVPFEPGKLTRVGRTTAALAYATRRVVTDIPRLEAGDAAILARIGAQLAENCVAVASALEHGGAPRIIPVTPMVQGVAPPGTNPTVGIATLAVLCTDLDDVVQALAAEAAGKLVAAG